MINVIKNPDGDSRCLEFICQSGDKEILEQVYTECNKEVKAMYSIDE